jgi:aspartate dehydrogenase
MAKLSIGIAGCGAIGGSLAKAIAREFPGMARLSALYDINLSKARRISRRLAVSSLDRLIGKCDLVIEAASAAVSADIAKRALAKGKSVMVMSVGGLLGKLDKLARLAQKNNCRIIIPSGAISGIDGLKAAGVGQIKSATLTTTKSPLAFKGVGYIEKRGIKLQAIKKARVLFSGAAKDAVKFFPQNINVAAVLSLAGIGAGKTKVNIVADPKVKRNIHQIRIESEAGRIISRTENVLHPDNPKTSYLAVLSAVATLKGILEPVKIGT